MADHPRIVRIEWGRLEGRRPRIAGANARLGMHGDLIHLPLVRLTTEDGATGFGLSGASREDLDALLEIPWELLFTPETGVSEQGRPIEYPLWDLIGQCTAQPVYNLAAAITGVPTSASLRAPCYDTSLYFDDLHLTSPEEAAQWIAEEAKQGYGAGHRSFKLKVGRGARHLPSEEGTARDIAIIREVRKVIGPDCHLLLDANNGYTLNLAKHVLTETAGCNIFWLEEAFHEDSVLYRDLKDWLTAQGLSVLIADGEGEASPSLLRWAQEGLIDVIQYDIFSYGLTRWLHLGKQLDTWGVRSAPHHYGGYIGNYVGCHLASALKLFTFVEWDEATMPGIDTSGYRIENGYVTVPDMPGFGLILDDACFREAVLANGGEIYV